METQGIVIWARHDAGALIIWCADSGRLAYVADRRREGDANGALCIGDFIDVRIETRGAMRIGRNLRYRASRAGWLRAELDETSGADAGGVMSPCRTIAGSFAFGGEALTMAEAARPANRSPKRGTGTD